MPTKEIADLSDDIVDSIEDIIDTINSNETITTTWMCDEEKSDKHLFIKCDDRAETLVFTKYRFDKSAYEISIEDDYCGHRGMGIANRFKRAWCAFWAKPIVHNSVFIQDEKRIRKFLEDCIGLVDEE